MQRDQWRKRLSRLLACALVALVAAACASTPAAEPTTRADLASRVSGGELAARLGLTMHPLDDAGKIVMDAPDGDSILVFVDTTVVTVHGAPFTASEPARLRAGDVWFSQSDASAIESLWNSSVRNEPRDWPLKPLPAAWRGRPGARSAPAPASRGYGDQPTAAEVRNWSVARLGSQWNYIVIHHSATDTGSAAAFDKEHRVVRRWEGLGYDFVIGNGAGSPDGAVEVGYRWREQKRGAHAGNELMNIEGIGICLVGNFTKTRPSAAQMRSLSRLCNFLSNYCDIPRENYRLHGDVRQTACPGPLFPRDFLAPQRSSRTYAGSPDDERGTK